MTRTEFAPAKLNLALHVRARRPDGYHALDTLFAFVADGDRLTIAPADHWQLDIRGPFAAGLETDERNLVTRAAHAFASTLGVSIDLAVTLEKVLPVASGIGGGSADAAAILRGLARLHDVLIDDARLIRIAEALGSDVPACLKGVTALATGRGERLQPVGGLAGVPVLLVNPGVPLSTAAVFAGWDGIDRGPLPAGGADTIAREGRNDLEAAAIALVPVIADVLHALAADGTARVVRMSGSGATCFALFDDASARDATAAQLRSLHPAWWVFPTTLA